MATVLWHASGSSYAAASSLHAAFVFLLLLLLVLPRPTTECDQRFISIPDGPQNGTFHAPSLVNPDGESRQCVYTFLAGPNQRVELVFTNFGLRGTPPDGAAVGELPACVHEYMDVYTEIRTDNTTKLIETPFGGRYCGPIPPRKRVSLYQGIALSFYTDKNVTHPNVFEGKYAFINASEYEIGTPAPSLPCSFVINHDKRNGSILSPTYPGIYPKDLVCSYQFIGKPGLRVRLEFRDFDLFFGGPHCPFDYVKVYDGRSQNGSVIGTYCGQQRNLVLYSSDSDLFVLFVTLQRTANTQNRGFKGIFEFSESFIKLDFITNFGQGEHIRGTECDQKILSRKKSVGYVVSPNFPYPYLTKVVCRYFIYGMQDSQHLERVKLEFETFGMPLGKEVKPDTQCTDGYLKLYLKGQEATDSYDKHDYELCGIDIAPAAVVSDGPRLVMVFSSGEAQGKGFKAKYTFETEYRIPGTAAPDGSCTFTYRSSSRKRGEFNSPRYPSNYPSDTNCTYFFEATPNEQVTIVFDHFKVRTKNFNVTGHYGAEFCQDDWLEVYNMYRDNTDKLIGRYCGMTSPGPVASTLGARGVKVILHTDSELVYSGFKARYIFENAKSILGDCGSNMSSNLNNHSGEITSPNYPNKYEAPSGSNASKTCNWFLSVRPNHQILLDFQVFSVEGDQLARGCPAAVLRMWISANSTPVELCGVMEPEAKWSYISEDHNMRLSFLSADKAVGQAGFKAVWTEIQQNSECRTGFLCEHNGYCIHESLRCNDVNNCGPDDTSDEDHCSVPPPPENYYAVPAGSASIVMLCLVILCLVCHRRLKRRGQDSGSGGVLGLGVPGHLDDLQQRVDERTGRCFHHHHHHHHYHHQHQQQQQQQLLHHHHHHHPHMHHHHRPGSRLHALGADDDDDDLDEQGSLTGFAAGDYRLQPSPPSDEDEDSDEAELVIQDDDNASARERIVSRGESEERNNEEEEELAEEELQPDEPGSSSPESCNTATQRNGSVR